MGAEYNIPVNVYCCFAYWQDVEFAKFLNAKEQSVR